MKWLRKVREEDQRSREENPEAYAMQMRKINEEMDIKYGKSKTRSIYR